MKFYSEIYKAFIIAGIISFVISMATSGKVSYGAQVTGFASVAFAVMLILILLFNNITKDNSKSATSLLSTIVMTSGPFILLLAISAFVMYVMIDNRGNIVNDQVAPKYKTFRNITELLIILQMVLVMASLNSDSFKNSGQLSGITSAIMCLFSVFTLASSLILYVVLTFYKTDG